MTKKTQKHRFIASIGIQPGDFIFYFSVGAVQGNLSAQSVEHVGICVGHNEKNIPLIAHATYGNNISHVDITPLTALYGYLVYRLSESHDPKNRLKQRIAKIATAWASHTERLPYDRRRRQNMLDFLKDKSDTQTALTACKEDFIQQGGYRALKFAIRGDQPIKTGSPRGFRCDQFIILCVQAAELQLFNEAADSQYFTPLVSPNNAYPWISISNPDRTLIKSPPSNDYNNILGNHQHLKQYANHFTVDLQSRKNKHEVTTLKTGIAPMMYSVAPYFLDNLNDIYHSLIPLNAKACSPSILLTHLSDDDGGSGFKPVGIIVGQQHTSHFPDHHIIEHEIITVEVSRKTHTGTVHSEGDHLYTKATQSILFPALTATPNRGLPQTLSISTQHNPALIPCLTLLFQHHQQLNDSQLGAVIRHIKRRHFSESWQNLSSNTQTALGQRLFHLLQNDTIQEEPQRKKVCARQHH